MPKLVVWQLMQPVCMIQPIKLVKKDHRLLVVPILALIKLVVFKLIYPHHSVNGLIHSV